MRKNRDEKYFVRINPDLILSFEDIKWKSKFSRWLYVCLILDYNNNLQKDIDKPVKVKYNLIRELFHTSRKTLHSAVNDLVAHGLLMKTSNQNKFKLVNDKDIYRSGKSKKKFFKIYNNFFIRLLEAGLSTRQLYIYYYLYNKYYHLDPVNGYTITDETQSSIVKKIHSRNDEVKDAIEVLINLGLLMKDEYGTIYVKEQNGFLNVVAQQPVPEIQETEQSGALFQTIEEYEAAIGESETKMLFGCTDPEELFSMKIYVSRLQRELHDLRRV